MGKNHRDNYKARKKAQKRVDGNQGNSQKGPFQKKKERRGKKKFTGAWNVEFTCGKEEYIPFAGSNDIKNVASKSHKCDVEKCVPVKFHPIK